MNDAHARLHAEKDAELEKLRAENKMLWTAIPSNRVEYIRATLDALKEKP